MKKQILPLLFIPFVLASCKNNSTDMPKSPFDDTYVRIGMKGEYEVNLTSLPASDYANLKSAIQNYKDEEKKATKVVRKEEMRDLKYAYFGNEVGSASRCALLTRTDTESRYLKDDSNYVTTKEAVSHQENQTANAGVLKSDSKTVDYIYDVNYLDSSKEAQETYGVRTSVKNNEEQEVVTQTTIETKYDSTKFDLESYKNGIMIHFAPGKIRGEDYNFGILRDVNSAVYGKCNIDSKERYLIKEGYSVFAPYTTTVGRTYKAVDNYFYEGLLEEYVEPKIENEGEKSFRFTSFRFYHEVLILSEACDGLNVPVLYLEKPVVVDYDEVKYEISYDSLGEYTGTIPEPTKK